MKLFKDILKTKVEGNLKYSQGRVYLFVFVIIYIAILTYYMFIPNTSSMQTIIDSVQWAILLFATYVFATNGTSVTKDIFKIKNGKDIITTVENSINSATPTTTASDNTPPSDITTSPSKEEDLSV